MRFLFENKKQKTVWIIYILVVISVYVGINNDNSQFSCTLAHHCASLVPPITVTSIIAVVLACVLQSKKKE